MKKKLLSVVLSVLMILSVFSGLNASAESVALTDEIRAQIASDYVPGEMTGNLFSSFWQDYSASYSNDGTTLTLSTTGARGDGVAANQQAGSGGAGVSVSDSSFWNAGNTFVFGVNARNNSGTPRVKLTVMQTGRETVMPLEYPVYTDGAVVTNTEYKRYGFTMTVPETFTNYNYCRMYLGFPETPAGETEGDRSVSFDIASAYLGIEYAYDLVVEADTAEILSGTDTTVNLTATVVNQGNVAGTLPQNITWYAVNKERTEIVDGLTITEGAEGEATLHIASSVPKGEYDIVAVSDVYSEFVGSTTISLINYASDYEPSEEITGNVTTGMYNNYSVSYSDNGAETTLTKDGACGNGILDEKQDAVAHGVGLSVPDRGAIWGAGRTIVFGAKVKNNGGEPRAKLGVWQASYPAVLPIETPGVSDGIAITDTEWQDVGFTIQVPETGINGPNDVIFYFGFADTPAGETEGNRSMIIKNDSVYLGLEYAYDIKLSADTTTWIPGKTEEINLDCDIVNQIGTTGSLNQDVEWFVMDSTRTNVVEGITVTDSGNGDGKAKVVVDHFAVPAGEYAIVAVSKENAQFVKGIKINVGYSPVLSELDLTKSGDTFTATAKLLGCDGQDVNAMIIVVALDENDEMIDCKVKGIKNVYASDGVTSEEYLDITTTGAVHHVNAFLWETNGAQNPDIFDTTRKEFAPMVTLLK